MQTQRKRLYMRSIRRGIKEMDLILQAYAQSALKSMSQAELDLYEQFLGENDHDLFAWVIGQTACPECFEELTTDIRVHAHGLIQI